MNFEINSFVFQIKEKGIFCNNMKMCYIVFMEKLIKKILNKENIFFEKIIKSTSGFTNIVYFVDNNYVVKIVAPNTKPEK